MANILGGLQGLLAGVGQGLGQIQSSRQQALENEQKARQIQVQEAEQKRMNQVLEWEKAKGAYESMMGEFGQEEITPLANQGLKFVKNPNGTFSRPLGAQEQTQLKNIDPAFIGQKAQLEYAPRAADSALDRQNAITLANTQGQNQLNLAGVNNAADLKQTEMTTGATRYSADRMYDRVTDAAGMKPIDPKQYNEWKMTMFATSPGAREDYNKAVQEFGAEIAESVLLDQFKTNFRPQ